MTLISKTYLKRQALKQRNSLFRSLTCSEEEFLSGGLYEALASPVDPSIPSPRPSSLDNVPIATGANGQRITVADLRKYLSLMGLAP